MGGSAHPSPLRTQYLPHPFPPHRVQELKLEEQQCQLDEKLRSYMNKEGECRHMPGRGSLCMVQGAGMGLWPSQALLWSPSPTDTLKTLEDEKAEQEILKQLVEVVNKRNVLIQLQEEKRLSELRA